MTHDRPRPITHALEPRDGGAAQAFEPAGEGECGSPSPPRLHQVVGEGEALAPDVIDHGMAGGGAGIRARHIRIVEQPLGRVDEELHPR